MITLIYLIVCVLSESIKLNWELLFLFMMFDVIIAILGSDE